MVWTPGLSSMGRAARPQNVESAAPSKKKNLRGAFPLYPKFLQSMFNQLIFGASVPAILPKIALPAYQQLANLPEGRIGEFNKIEAICQIIKVNNF